MKIFLQSLNNNLLNINIAYFNTSSIKSTVVRPKPRANVIRSMSKLSFSKNHTPTYSVSLKVETYED